jgi:RND family efflux transporter MFP subunit
VILRRISIGLTLCAAFGCGPQAERVEQAEVVRPARIHRVSGASAINRRTFVARVEAPQTVDLSFEVSGPLVDLPVKEGEVVAKGSVIAVLDPSDFQRAVLEAEVQLDLARADLARKRQLLKQNLMSVSLADEAEGLFKLREVRLAQAREDLSDTRITAPFEAYISQRFVDNHVNVDAGDDIVRVLDRTVIYLIANVPEEVLATADAEQVIRNYAEFAFAPGQRFEVEYYENRGEAGTVAQTYEVTFLMPQPPDLNILPGMTATVVLELGMATSNAVEIPPTALVAAADGRYFVWMFDRDSGMVTRRYVEADVPRAESVAIRAGLARGELIVAAGAQQLRDGMRVRALEEDEGSGNGNGSGNSHGAGRGSDDE